jgi:hypothetical protein
MLEMTATQDTTPYSNSLFQQPWWLNTVAPGAWNAVVVEKHGVIHARLPYIEKRRLGLRMLTRAPLSPILGPWLASTGAKYTTELGREKDLMFALIEQLPPHDFFLQNFHYSITNWLPFYWKGFNQTVNYTYVIEELTDSERIWAGFRENIRREVRKASKQVKVRDDLGLEQFLDLNVLTFGRHGKRLPYSREYVRRLDAACVAHKARRMFFAEDAYKRVHAAAYIVWDKDSAYYLMGGIDPALRGSGGMSLVMWEAIKFASTVTRKFDFEGSMMEPVERFFRAFGARQVPYFQVTRISRRMKFLLFVNNRLKTVTTYLSSR